MSRRKMYNPGTTVPGGRPVLDKMGQPVFDRKGRPAWFTARPVTTLIHFKSAAAKCRVIEKARAMGVTFLHVAELLPIAEPRDLVRVPVYRGFSARFANEVRGKVKAGRPWLPRKLAA